MIIDVSALSPDEIDFLRSMTWSLHSIQRGSAWPVGTEDEVKEANAAGRDRLFAQLVQAYRETRLCRQVEVTIRAGSFTS